MQATVRDITEQKKSEEKLKKSDNELAKKVADLEKLNRLAVDRELKMIELKKTIMHLKKQLNEDKKSS